MVKQGGGIIVNISALAGHWRASLAGVQYTAAKAGVEGLTRQLAYDWGKTGIRVNAVAPTVTLTGDRVREPLRKWHLRLSFWPRMSQAISRGSPLM
jgi:NAD(P)-dependent dehydrogenase (short-subunit alcohol dehydrogenase family)